MASIDVSEVAEWYRNRTVFITGGTGFMGKVLVAKLLTSCPVRRIYILIRPKKGMDIDQRLEVMFSYRLFDALKATQPEVLQKVAPIKGDITMECLGLSDEDEERLADEVSVVFHAAATINFQEPLRVAVNMNMLGTKRVISLAQKIKNLQALVHVSTAYGNCHVSDIVEDIYPAPIDPARLIQLTEWLDDETLEAIVPRLVHPRPNTYTYTKALAEHILVQDASNLPVVIIRPSIVCGAWREPAPGWVDNMFAFSGLLVGMGKGVLRSLYVSSGIVLDFVPVDVPINLMIVAAWNAGVNRFKPPSKVPIYCCSTGSQTPLTVENLADHLKLAVRNNPLNSPLWYPDGSAKTNKALHLLHVYAVNVIPAYIFDFIMRMLGKKPFAVKLCNKMIKATNALEYFMLRDWTFHNANTCSLWAAISQTDGDLFHFDVSDLDWAEYITTYQRGCKQYIMKEDPSTIPAARKTLRILYWIHKLTQLALMYAAWCLVSSQTSTKIFSTFLAGASNLFSLAPILAAAEDSSEL